MQAQHSTWKYVTFILIILLGLIYASPNLFGDDPAVQISSPSSATLPQALLSQVKQTLDNAHLQARSMSGDSSNILVRFKDPDTQLKARDLLKGSLGDQYVVALNLAPRTPKFFQIFGAQPMKLGLDLRGGVHFLLQVDMDAVIKARLEGEVHDFSNELRQEKIPYSSIDMDTPQSIAIKFPDQNAINQAYSMLPGKFTMFSMPQ
jgi:preprotein translocase subunit SecD